MQEHPDAYHTNQPLQSPPPAKSSGGLRDVVIFGLIILAAIGVAAGLTRFVFQSYEVDGPSMETTLDNRDRLIVWKVPRSIARVTNHDYVPNRGDIVVFKERNLPQIGGPSGEKQLIKRVIGVPGDQVRITNGVLTIFNTEHPNGYQPDKNSEWEDAIRTTTGEVDITVEENTVFVVGDNRQNSADSRVFGTVPADDIVGTLALRIYPLNKAQIF